MGQRLSPAGGAGLGELIERMSALVEAHGWAVMTVLDDPTLGYSVGLYKTFGHPEIVIRGFAPPLMHDLINDMGERVRAGERFEPGRSYDRIIKSFSCPVIEVSRGWRAGALLACKRLYGAAEFPAVQLLLPDAAGRFPTDGDCDPVYRRLQPLMNAVPPARGAGTNSYRRAGRTKRGH
jgi:hypothetical protein